MDILLLKCQELMDNYKQIRCINLYLKDTSNYTYICHGIKPRYVFLKVSNSDGSVYSHAGKVPICHIHDILDSEFMTADLSNTIKFAISDTIQISAPSGIHRIHKS